MTARMADRVDTSLPYHAATGLYVDLAAGAVFNRHGRQVGSSRGHDYKRVSKHQRLYYVHRLVWESAHGPLPDGSVVDHINGDKSDNRIANLEAVSHSENMRRAGHAGLMARGERSGVARLRDSDVLAIRSDSGITDTEWAKRLHVARSTVSNARTGRAWRHLAGARQALTESRPSHPPVAPVETARARRVEGSGSRGPTETCH